MRRVLLAATAITLLALTQAASAQDAPVLRIGLREDPDALDPTLARSYVGRIVFASLCDKLFDINDKLEIVPQLALGYEWLDPKTVRIDLRRNVKFHDGTEMDAAAVKYSLERHLTMQGSARRGEISTLDHVDVVDPYTVKVSLKSPTAPFIAVLTDRAGMIVSPKAAEAAGKDFALHPVCAGPFKFAERVAQDHITLDKFDDYWDAKDIHVSKVIFRSIVDSTTTVANLRAGSIDLAENIVPSDVNTVKNDPKTKIITSPSLGYQSININVAHGELGKGPMSNVKVRKAFEAAIDRDAINNVVFNGMFTPNAQAISPSSPFYDKDIKTPGRDVALAKKLLAEAGVKTPVTFSMNVPNSPVSIQTAEVIQSMVAEAGFDMKIKSMEFATSLDAGDRGDFETYMIAWSGRADPDGNLWNFDHTGGPLNYPAYSNPEMDHLLDEARAVTDTQGRIGIYKKVAELAERDLPIMLLYTPMNIVGTSAKLSGFVPVPDGLIRPQGITIAK